MFMRGEDPETKRKRALMEDPEQKRLWSQILSPVNQPKTLLLRTPASKS
jgi:hypothetical protein